MTLLGARHDAGNAWSRLAPGATPSSGAVPSRRAISGAWSPQDGPGDRLFAEVGPLRRGSGDTLEEFTPACAPWGGRDPGASTAVLVLHALTGGSHVRGPAGAAHPSPGWWETMVGPGLPLDTDRYFVIAPNVLGGCQEIGRAHV